MITLLPGSQSYIADRGGIPQNRVHWIPNGVDLGCRARNAAAWGRPHGNCYTGAHGLANALEVVLDAAALLQADGWGDRVSFRLVGEGPARTA